MRCCVPHGRAIGRTFALLVSLVALACGGEAENEPARTIDEGANRPNDAPIIERVALDPVVPVPGEAVRVAVQVSDPDGDPVKMTYEWKLRGEPVGNGTAKLMLTSASRGDRLEVVVVASDGRTDSEPASVSANLANRPPKVERIHIGPSLEITAGEQVEVSAEGRDPENDTLEFSYAWRVNGEPVPASDAPTFDTRSLATGDLLRVEVVADDGDDRSEPFRSPEIRVTNRPPRVVSKPSPSKGGAFDYSVVAEDPDGDAPLRFELEEAPAGMEIGAHNGRIHWRPRIGQAGRHQVRVLVDDERGGQVAHVFEVNVGGSEPPASVGP